MSKNRVVLAYGSRLLREMLHRVLDKASNLEVVQEVVDRAALPIAIQRFDPAWVIVAAGCNGSEYNWLKACTDGFPSVQFIFLSPENSTIQSRGQATHAEDLANLSLNDFIRRLERDLQHT